MQTKPLRSYGVDVTQQSLQPIVQQLGITDSNGEIKSVKQMSQAEKEILRYIATLKQAQVAMGDMANTIESPSNQLKVFKQQLVEAKVALTSLFMGGFSSILPYANAILMVVKEVSKAIADLFGIKLTDYNSGIATTEDAYLDLGDSIDDATASAKELKRQTLGFDQINNINEDKNSGSGSGGSSVSGGIDKRLLDAISGYDNGMESVRMKAAEIRDRIMEWLGFTYDAEEEVWKLNDELTNAELILGGIATVLGIGIVKKIVKAGFGVKGFIDGLKTAETGATIAGISMNGWTGIIVSAIGQTINLKYQFDKFNQKIKEGKSAFEALIPTSVGDAISKLVGQSTMLTTFGAPASIAKDVYVLLDALGIINNNTKTENSLLDETKNKVKKIEDVLGNVSYDIQQLKIGSNIIIDNNIVGDVKKDLEKLTNAITKNISTSKETLTAEVNEMIKSGYMTDEEGAQAQKKIETYYSNITTKTEEANNRINEILSIASEEKRSLTKEERDEVSRLYEEIRQNTISSLTTSQEEQAIIMQKIKDADTKLSKQTASQLISDAIKVKDEAIKNAETQYDETLREAQKMLQIGAINEEQYNKICEDAKKTKDSTIKEAEEQYDTIWTEFETTNKDIASYIDKDTGGVKSSWAKFWDDIGTGFTTKWDEITDWWDTNIAPFFTKEKWESIFNKIGDGIQNAISTCKSKVKSFVNNVLVNPFNNVIDWINSKLNLKFQKLEISILGQKIKIWDGFEKQLFTIPHIPQFANGGMPEDGLFFANHTELVGKFVNGKTAVANNEQIVEGISQGVYQAVISAMSQFGGQSSQIDVHVHTDEGAVVDRINQRTKQTGVCPINI